MIHDTMSEYTGLSDDDAIGQASEWRDIRFNLVGLNGQVLELALSRGAWDGSDGWRCYGECLSFWTSTVRDKGIPYSVLLLNMRSCDFVIPVSVKVGIGRGYAKYLLEKLLGYLVRLERERQEAIYKFGFWKHEHYW